ncbi:MAG TPA: methylmalonyl-CoA mutase [Deltaproteobacteria bacterium]|nr:MAG: methylmalonyl-CoA mutase [Deltaproteobacteria bacterium GWA2_65_63]OGP26053.1 MAG: methylmalonyl-CoA mutase [Deltaproteobacteria bacterium GWB2_65_81]OGP38933.1 MAG: methylmalonyl-CoA mutase [Deltaproteobacteria bacterium GWC2_66_88]HBG72251.1 methylmalonyl-CoA mutase [Deltaproteobacteria bacterium]
MGGKNGKGEIRASRERWERKVLADTTAKSPERRARFESTSGEEIGRLYTPEHLEEFDYLRDAGFPGEYPFTRGVQPTMYRGRLWTMRQYAGFGDARESNTRYRYLLDHGQTGLSVAFDLPTQMGYDSDSPMSFGEVGKVGVAIDSLEDMEILFDRIPLGKVSTSMTINSTAAILLAMYIAVGEKQGVTAKNLNGTIQNDILKEYIARGTYIFPPAPSMRIITDIFAFCKDAVPRWNTISISGYHIREAGSTAAQEIAFTLANGIAYVQAAIDAGMSVDSFASRLAFFFNAHNNFLEEIAKFRAARRLWGKIMRERFGAADPRSWMLRFHTQTAGSSLTAQQPDNNIVRVTMQALSAVLGGTQSLHTNSRDEALSLPSEESVRIALRTQQLIAHESGVADTIDPLGGSYCVEAMTSALERQAAEYIRRIDGMGGVIPAVDSGYIQKEIQDAAYRYQLEVERKERIIVGVNDFVLKENPPEGLLKVNPRIEKEQRKRLAALRKRREAAAVQAALGNLASACRGKRNVMGPILDAVRAYATLGEISDVMRSVFGTHQGKATV